MGMALLLSCYYCAGEKICFTHVRRLKYVNMQKKKRKVIQEAAVFLDKKHCNVCIPDIKGSFLYLRVYDLRGKEKKKIHPFPVRILIVRLLVINLDKVHINII